jgi:predicted enzyme related to lactoylglutathione lyase
MSQNIKLIVYPVLNLEVSKSFYQEYLGLDSYADSEYYVGFKMDDLEVGLDPRSKEIISYIEVDDIQASLHDLIEAGATLHKDIKNIGDGIRIAQIKDPNGHILGLRQVEY